MAPTPTPAAADDRDPDNLSEPEAAALEAVVRGRWAWTAQIFLVASGHDPATIAGLVRRGHLAPWDTPMDPACVASRAGPPCGLVLTLSPHAAESLSVEIVEEGAAERPRWQRIRLDERGRRTDAGKPPVRAFAYELRLPANVLDPTPGPEFLVDEESGEEIRLFVATADGGKTCGIPITIDRRLRGKKK